MKADPQNPQLKVLNSLVQGDRIRIFYKLETQRIPRVTVATFLYVEKPMYSGPKIIISGRPAYGTSELDLKDLLRVDKVLKTVKPHQNRMYRKPI